MRIRYASGLHVAEVFELFSRLGVEDGSDVFVTYSFCGFSLRVYL